MSLRLAKKRLIDDFYLVGILEQFEDTLLLLERTLPRFFKGAVSTWKGKCKLLFTASVVNWKNFDNKLLLLCAKSLVIL